MTEISASMRLGAGSVSRCWGENFDALAEAVRRTWINTTAAYGNRVFRVTPRSGSTDLNTVWLGAFEHGENRQHHTCSACRSFLKRFGNLAVITDNGTIRSALWDPNDAGMPAEYVPNVRALSEAVAGGRIESVFYSTEERLGTAMTVNYTANDPQFHHFAVSRGAVGQMDRVSLLSPGQRMSLSNAHFYTFMRALTSHSRATIARAVTLLSGGTLPRAETTVAAARWLLEMKDLIDSRARSLMAESVWRDRINNLIWRETHGKPAGWLTPRTGMLGSLLEDIDANKSEAAIRASFAAKVDPTQYRRPTAAPRAGNVVVGERVVEQLGLAPSLARRYANFDEVDVLWGYTPAAPAATRRIPGAVGVFADVVTREEVVVRPSRTRGNAHTSISWSRFARTVLPTALEIDAWIEPLTSLVAIVKAVHDDAPPIIAWDSGNGFRNSFSWYTYSKAVRASVWSLTPSAWHRVRGVGLLPHLWPSASGQVGQHGNAAIAYIEGAVDTQPVGLGLFPEFLRGDLHAIRSTIEAYSNAGRLAGRGPQNAVGIPLGNGMANRLRVRTRAGYEFYSVVNWD